METIKNYINGEWVPPASGAYLDNYNPATGEVYSQVPLSDERDVQQAVAAAEKAFPQWLAMPAQERSRLLLRIAERIENDLSRLAEAESVDNGKPVWLAQSVDIPRAASNFRFFASGILHFFSESHAMENRALNYTLRQPIGVVGCISPWNLPLYLF
ncbi:MAG: aldehyde dehydrogenase family protein, partial [Calditrichaeota bacterium]